MLTRSEIDHIKEVREQCRKDLYFLSKSILGYNDIDPKVHGPYLKLLDGITEHVDGVDTVLPSGECMWTPFEDTPSTGIPAHIARRYLILGFRGSLKTTINVKAHSIQLLLNFPEISIFIYHNAEPRVIEILEAIVNQFLYNERLKKYFPEYALTKQNIKNFYTLGEFTTPARFRTANVMPLRKEASILAMGLGSSQAGSHANVIKMTDVVEAKNIRTETMREQVYKDIARAVNLLDDEKSFYFIEGTPYHPDDAYAKIKQKHWDQRKPEERSWRMVYYPCYEVDTRGRPRTYSPDEMDYPFAVANERIIHYPGDANRPPVVTEPGQRIPVWPTWRNGEAKFSNTGLDEQQRDDEFEFACQRLLRPTASDTATFPLSKCYHTYPENELSSLAKITQLKIMSVDTAETMNPEYSDFTAISCAIITETLLRVVVKGLCARLEAEEIVQALFANYAEFGPDVIIVEETSFTNGLKPTIYEHARRNGVSLPIIWEKRSTREAKKLRIRAALREPLISARLKFSDGLSKDYRDHVKMELSGFPTSKRDDVLDTLADICKATPDLAGFNDDFRRRQEAEQAAEERRAAAALYSRYLTGMETPEDELNWSSYGDSNGSTQLGF